MFLSDQAYATLEAEFQKNRNADNAATEQLATQLSLPTRQVQVRL